MEDERNLKALKIFLRVYGVLSLVIFIPLFMGLIVQSPLLAVGGP